jgi:S1-C subfamily serine protease
VSSVDWIIVLFTALLAIYGYVQGFIVGALSLVGFALGAFLGTRVAPLVLPDGAHSPYAPLFGLAGALLAGAVLASGFEGIGLHARHILRLPGLRLLDGLLGAALTGFVALGVAWVVGAVALDSSGSSQVRLDVQRSAILRALDRVLPPSGPILNALARFDPLPSVRGPGASVPAPTAGILASAGVRAALRSVVRVQGTACGLGIEGSGWVAAPDLVVTNAHVVAGERDTTVEVGGNPPDLPAQVMAFDPHDDISILRVADLPEPPLGRGAQAPPGLPAAILGYPQDGPFDEQPARLGATQTVSTEDAYGNGPVQRSITTLRGLVRPGNSGGPLVDADGQVVGTVFAAITDPAPGQGPGGFAIPDSLVAAQLRLGEARGAPVGSGPCAG